MHPSDVTLLRTGWLRYAPMTVVIFSDFFRSFKVAQAVCPNIVSYMFKFQDELRYVFWFVVVFAGLLYGSIQLMRREARKTLAANYIREYDLAHPRQGIRFDESPSAKDANELSNFPIRQLGMLMVIPCTLIAVDESVI